MTKAVTTYCKLTIDLALHQVMIFVKYRMFSRKSLKNFFFWIFFDFLYQDLHFKRVKKRFKTFWTVSRDLNNLFVFFFSNGWENFTRVSFFNINRFQDNIDWKLSAESVVPTYLEKPIFRNFNNTYYICQ